MLRLAVFIFLFLTLCLVLERVDGGPWAIATAAFELVRDLLLMRSILDVPF